MAFKSLDELIRNTMQTAPSSTLQERLRNELRDYLAHEPARFCKFKMDMTDYDILVAFVQFIIKKEML